MARTQQKQEEPERGRRAAPKRGMNPLIPLVVVVVILGGGVMAVVAGSGKKPAEAPKPVASNKPKPFDDLPPEKIAIMDRVDHLAGWTLVAAAATWYLLKNKRG